MIDAKQLIDEHGAELVRYLLLSTHYRRPIDFTDEVDGQREEGAGTFFRAVRADRAHHRQRTLDGETIRTWTTISADCSTARTSSSSANVLNFKMKFLEMMDDDFNTAGAIGVLHELAGEINSYIEQTRVDAARSPM